LLFEIFLTPIPFEAWHKFTNSVPHGFSAVAELVKFQVKLINLDGMSKRSAVILDFRISQGSVATQFS